MNTLGMSEHLFISVCIALFLSDALLEVAVRVSFKDGIPSHTAVILVLMLFGFQ